MGSVGSGHTQCYYFPPIWGEWGENFPPFFEDRKCNGGEISPQYLRSEIGFSWNYVVFRSELGWKRSKTSFFGRRLRRAVKKKEIKVFSMNFWKWSPPHFSENPPIFWASELNGGGGIFPPFWEENANTGLYGSALIEYIFHYDWGDISSIADESRVVLCVCKVHTKRKLTLIFVPVALALVQ